ncbi:tetratricopeptide repeat protein [Anabaena sp. FACHB-1250]|uniref:tetratricopeptide repeat protein n=2 Tax=unclassified Anabaena TaxID=2619674 RepID=UPI0016813064|nr:tetratricopeptide repeat protein [Anabaena sp. FACHB-1250]MBD2141900.1 tetratricopeptide repeat protein [Anabaena sp. FACHB-1250]
MLNKSARVGIVLTQKWINTSRFRETLHLCKSTLNIVESYEILTNLARSEQELGNIEQAQQDYQQALELCPATDKTTKAVIINNLASIYAKTGKIEEAIAHYQQSLEIKESIGNVQGQAVTLHGLASIYANTGKIEEAIAHYQQSLEIKESIGNVQGQAATLAMLGQLLAYNKGDFVTALKYLHQSLEIFQRIQSPDAETVRKIINDVQKMANG